MQCIRDSHEVHADGRCNLDSECNVHTELQQSDQHRPWPKVPPQPRTRRAARRDVKWCTAALLPVRVEQQARLAAAIHAWQHLWYEHA